MFQGQAIREIEARRGSVATPSTSSYNKELTLSVKTDEMIRSDFRVPSSVSETKALLQQAPHTLSLAPHLFSPEIESLYACGHYVSVQSFEAWSEMVRQAKAPPPESSERKHLLSLVCEVFCDYLANQTPLLRLAHRVTNDTSIAHSIDAVVAVPANPARYALRGFSLPHELGRALQGDLGLLFWPDALCSLAAPELQMRGMEFDRRAQAVQGSMVIGEDADVVGRTLLLVDDVVCSGSTVREAARLLLEAGAARVYVACLARVPLSAFTA